MTRVPKAIVSCARRDRAAVASSHDNHAAIHGADPDQASRCPGSRVAGGVAGQHPQRPAEPLPPRPEFRHPQQRLPGRQGRQLFRRRPRGLAYCLRVFDCRTPAVRLPVRDGADRGGGRPAGRSACDRPRGLRARASRTHTCIAVDQARRCRAAAWWCDLVMGLALHRAGRSAAAGVRYRSALRGRGPRAGLPADRHPGTPGRERRGLPTGGCPVPARSGRQYEERFWWLSDPLLSRPGNDRRTEHLTRRFELLLHERLWRDGLQPPRPCPQYHIDVTRRGHPDSWRPRGRELETWKSEARERATALLPHPWWETESKSPPLRT